MSRRLLTVAFAIMALTLVSVSASAKNDAGDTITTNLKLTTSTSVGSTKLAAGSYKVIADGSKAKFEQGNKVVAEIPCSLKDFSAQDHRNHIHHRPRSTDRNSGCRKDQVHRIFSRTVNGGKIAGGNFRFSTRPRKKAARPKCGRPLQKRTPFAQRFRRGLSVPCLSGRTGQWFLSLRMFLQAI